MMRTRRIIAHSDNVGVGIAVLGSGGPAPGTVKPGVDPPVHAVMAFESRVTVPLRASALPFKLALVAMVMLVSARMLPCIALKVPIAAELPTCHQRSHGVAPLIKLTLEAAGPEAVVSDVACMTYKPGP